MLNALKKLQHCNTLRHVHKHFKCITTYGSSFPLTAEWPVSVSVQWYPNNKQAACVLLFHESKSVTTVENWFLTKFRSKPPMKESNRCQCDNSVAKGSICQGKNSSYPPASEQTVDNIRSLKSKDVNQKNLEFHQALFGQLSVRV